MIIYNKVFFRDKFVDFKDANLSIASSPVLYGLSTYSVMPIYLSHDKTAINLFRLSDHYQRLLNSSKILGFDDFINSWTEDSFKQRIIELVSQNKIKSDSLLRMTVFIDDILPGATSHKLKCSLALFIYPMASSSNKSFKVLISSWRRNPDNALPARAKVNGAYVNSALMKNEALHLGFDDALALDESGHLTESTVSNFFMIRNKTLITPGNSSDLLEGLTRDTIIKIARILKLPVELRSIDRTELYLADEAFLSGSSLSIMPITQIDDKLINKANIGVFTQKISSYYQKMVRCEVEDQFHFANLIKL